MITNNNAKEEKNKNQKIYDSCEYMPRSVNNKSVSLLDRELGTLRGNFFKVKILFINIYNYLKSFFTRRKLDQVKSVFLFKDSKEKLIKKHETKSINAKDNKLKH